jgi:predicted ATP-dependent endonuclease of OLD family
MKIDYLYINGYKNLNNLKVYFEEDSNVNAFIGNNGSGKSNMLEALTIIFSRAIVRSNDFGFEFCLKYSIDTESIEINKIEINNIEGDLVILRNDKKVLKKDTEFVLPKSVFLYYSGETIRLKQLSNEVVDRRFDRILKRDENIALKYITYLSVKDFGASLLVNYIFENNTYKKICKLVDINDVCSPIMIKLKRPSWGTRGKVEEFWGSIGTVGYELRKLVDKGDFIINDKDSASIEIMDLSSLKDDSIGALGLFTVFKVLEQAGILEGIEFNIIKGNEKFSYSSLSEGEKQLAHLLSVLEITKDYKALFMLDEFDSYLHPKWQRQFVDILNGIEMRGQVLFTTHSPLTLGKMKSRNIILLKEGIAYNPSSETINRDVSEVLEELMDVERRPPEIEANISNFRNYVAMKDIEKATKELEKLEVQLSDDDPFFISSKISLERINRGR